jgi:hypothetical protein
MNLVKYPNYESWVRLLAHRNVGVLAVVALAAATLLVLLEIRWLWPRLYPVVRDVGFLIYLVCFAGSLIIGVLSR